MGSLILKTTPTFFEGINEKGLMGGHSTIVSLLNMLMK
ncbi:hypothetical protein HMPREF9402_2437 [Turicibacter sp. HGF1]|nr:hypothetical protein HMPREF9402_2437 [Turicibacter sp. HGF1]